MKNETLTPEADADAKAGTSSAFKLAEKREDGTIVLETEDGRMFTALQAEGLEGELLKSSTLTIKHDGIVDGVPVNPVITKAVRKD